MWHPLWASAVAAIAATVLLAVCAKPIVDGDLWYHLAYARQMLTAGALTLDHTAFSWTPADNTVIYCAWISQLGLYGLHRLGGLPMLFVLRYAVFVGLPVAAGWYARRLGVAGHPITWLMVLVALLMSSAALFIKPQLASYALMTATVLAWFNIRAAGPGAWRWCYAIPALMLIWVNSHGGFVVGCAFLAVAAAGDLLNAYLTPASALPALLRRHLFVALALTALAVVATPYGLRYPLQFLTVDLPAIDLQAVREYDSIFAPAQQGLRYVDHGLIAAVLLSLLLFHRWRRHGVDWSLLLMNVVFAALYAYYVRMTLFWAPIALLSVISLLHDPPAWLNPTGRARHTLGALVVGLSLLLGARAVRSEVSAPIVGGWLGFGNGYWNPEEEADYIARHFAGARIGNDYNAGGYLIWRLWPTSRVFIDSRYFPYRPWFQEYLQLESTNGIEAFVNKHPVDLWCIDLLLPRTVAWFGSSPDWVPAFYGSSAAIFVKRGTPLPGERLQSGEGIGGIRNLYQAMLVVSFAIEVNDLDGAQRTVAGMERRFTAARDRAVVDTARAAVDGMLAYRRRDYEAAVRLLSPVAPSIQGRAAAVLGESALLQMNRLWVAGDLEQALASARVATRIAAADPIPRYNAGVIEWWLQRQAPPPSRGGERWRQDLEAFLALRQNSRHVVPDAVTTAQNMLQGLETRRPRLIVPPEPPPASSPP